MNKQDKKETPNLTKMSEVERLQWVLRAAREMTDVANLSGVAASGISEAIDYLNRARKEYNRRISTLSAYNRDVYYKTREKVNEN